jgi:hypothetical protein
VALAIRRFYLYNATPGDILDIIRDRFFVLLARLKLINLSDAFLVSIGSFSASRPLCLATASALALRSSSATVALAIRRFYLYNATPGDILDIIGDRRTWCRLVEELAWPHSATFYYKVANPYLM